MNDQQILDLFWSRSEKAISETAKKYGKYCRHIAFNILRNTEDSEECVSDTYLKAWDNIPPKRPDVFSAYLGKITRNISLNKYKSYNTNIRGKGQVVLALEELQECIPISKTLDQAVEEHILIETLNHFLSSLPIQTRKIFLRRYWYLSSIKEIAAAFHLSESNTKMILFRTRNELKTYLDAYSGKTARQFRL